MWRWITLLLPIFVLPLMGFALGEFFWGRGWECAVAVSIVVVAAYLVWDANRRFGKG